jgi:hypothetical protein
MTEPLLMGLCLFGVALTWRWIAHDGRGRAWPIGATFALACLTRYEAWPITAAAVTIAGVVLVSRGVAWTRVIGYVATLAAYPLGAVVAFLFLSHATVGAWLVTDGFYEIEPAFYRRPLVSPGRHVGWVLIAEQARMRDQLTRLKEGVPGWLDGFERLCEGGGVTLYRRTKLGLSDHE